MKKIIMYSHGGSGNHGCEAIVLSTAKILKNYKDITLFSTHLDQDREAGLDKICRLERQNSPVHKFSFGYIEAAIQYHLMHQKDAFDRLAFDKLFQTAKGAVALSIGGDNYCYGHPGFIYFINKHLREQGTPTILWGCSIEPGAIDTEMLEDLKGYCLITARESVTFEVLRERGLSQSQLFPDPAFQLDQVNEALPDGFAENNTVGLNISPLVLNYETTKGITLTNFVVLIEHILKTTNMQIALIPHVTWDNNNDLAALQQLYARFKDSGRIVLIGNHGCRELKGYIARCRFFIGARTHAIIAAYSSCVPTLAIGYSVKARGIARDIFGTEDDMTLSVQSIKHEKDLVNAFEKIRERENEIRSHLQSVMGKYKQRAMDAGKALQETVGL